MRFTDRRSVARILTAALVCAALLSPAAAVGAWEEVLAGPSPINEVSTRVAQQPSFASVGGVPYVAWSEANGAEGQIWVKRLNAAGTAWERVGGTSPLNVDDARDATHPSLADIGGVPWVSWSELDGTNREIRVARLTAAGTWQEVGSGLSPINVDPLKDALTPSLTSIGGVAHVAWSEAFGVSLSQIRAARFAPLGSEWEDVGAALNIDPGHEAFEPSLADVAGVPHVAWVESDGTFYEVRAARRTGAAWVEIEPGASPMNHLTSESARSPHLAVVGGFPHIAWVENNAGGDQVHASRLNIAGTDWAPVVAGESPLNHSAVRDANRVSLADVGGVPYIAWTESDGVNDEARVTRLSASGTAWEEIARGPSPVNAAPTSSASHVDISTVGGFPWIAWSEDATTSRQVRVGRLEPEFGTAGAVPTVNGTLGAVLFGSLKTYGLPYQAGFTVTGPGGGDTGLAPTAGDLALLQRDVSGLSPSTVYSYRPFATAGVAQPRVLGASAFFTTLPARAAIPPPTPTTDPLVAGFADRLIRTKAGTRIKLRYVSTRPGRATLELRRGAKLVRRFSARPRAGLNAFTILAPTAGAYRLILTVTTADAKTTKATARLIVRRKR